MNKKCIIIAGPTAVGKTAAAIQVALNFSTQIISADSRQCYKELNIGVAKPSVLDLCKVPHHFISSRSIEETVNAAIYEKFALEVLQDIFTTNDVAVIVGGTGLYIKALAEGLNFIPSVPPEIRDTVRQKTNQYGFRWLYDELKREDPVYASQGSMDNPQRMMRALEVILATKKSILSFQTQEKSHRDFEIIQIGLELPRDILYNRINERVDIMMEQGLLYEAESLYEFESCQALQTVGYTELFDFLKKKISLDKAISLIKQHSRHYAKRQITWFKKDPSVHWMAPEEEIVLDFVSKNIK